MKFLKLVLFLSACALALPAQTVVLMPLAHQQFFDSNGKPLAGGSISTYAAGTSTPLATYTDASGAVANPNPIPLDASGAPQSGGIWLSPATYKIVAKSAAGVTQWTTDNVSDLALAGSSGVSVKSYGAKADGSDDTAAIAAACTAAAGGLVNFPAGTYKITSGGITTCAPGTTLQGTGVTLDLTSLTTYAFGFNIGGSMLGPTAKPTTIQGFRLLGNAANTTASFLRVERLANVAVRDIMAQGIQLGAFYGETPVVIDHASLTGFPAYGILLNQGTSMNGPSGSSLRSVICQDSAGSCIEIQSGTIQITDPFINNVAIGVHVNSQNGGWANASISNGQFALNIGPPFTQRGVVIDSLAGNALATIIHGSDFLFAGGASSTTVAIDVTATPGNGALPIVNVHASFRQITVSAAASVYRASVASTVNFSGCTFNRVLGAAALHVFDLTPAAVSITDSSFTGNTFQAGASNTINLVKPSPLGNFSGLVMTGNTFSRATNFLNMGSNTIISGNTFSGESTPAMTLGGTTLTGNVFTANPAGTITVKAANCSNNVGYACN